MHVLQLGIFSVEAFHLHSRRLQSPLYFTEEARCVDEMF